MPNTNLTDQNNDDEDNDNDNERDEQHDAADGTPACLYTRSAGRVARHAGNPIADLMPRLLLIGGGHAHLSVLRALALKKMNDVDIVLVTPASYQNYSGMLPGWMAGQYALAQCRVDLLPLVQAAQAQVITQSIVAIDANRRRVTLADGREVEYDLLSLDIGSDIDTSSLQQSGDKLLPVKPLDGFFDAWPTVLAAARSRSASTPNDQSQARNGGHVEDKGKSKDNAKDNDADNERPPYRLVVVGGGAAGVELALAARHAFAIAQCDACVDLVVGDSGLLTGLGAGARRRVARFLVEADVTLHRCRAVGAEQGVLLSNGTLLTSDCVIAATGARAPAWLQSSGLLLDAHGYIAVDASHRSLSHDSVFAAGDVCARQDTKMARSGVHAVHAGPVLAANLLATLAGKPGKRLMTYRPKRRSLYLLACGPRYAIASWGGLSVAGAWVWRWKDRIDRSFIARFSSMARPDGPNKPDRPDRPTTGQGAA